MNSREKILAAIVGGIVFLLTNVFLIDYFVKNHRRLRQEATDKALQLQVTQTLLSERDFWKQRAAWIQANQPRLTNERGASVELLGRVKEVADKHKVLVSGQELGEPKRGPHYISAEIKNVEAKCTWENLIAFLVEMQKPEEFIVFENANIEVDKENKTEFKATFRIAKWYALETPAM